MINNNTMTASDFSLENQITSTEIGLSQIKEEFEEDPGMLSKKYQTMSLEEMSKRMAENHRQLSAMLSPTTSMSSSPSASTFDREEQEEEEEEEEEEENDPHKKHTNLFARICSNGDLDKVKELLSNAEIRPFINMDAKDRDGTPPLVYAACFGKIEIAKALIEAGASIDVQDSFGWSALMWATNNSHESLVKILLDHGASSQTKSAKGRTVFDFVNNTDNQKIIDILATNPRDSVSSTSSMFYRTSSVSSSSSTAAGGVATEENDFYYKSTMEGFDQFMSEEAEIRKKLFESTMGVAATYNSSSEEEDDEEESYNHDDYHHNQDDTSIDEDMNEFHWDKCSPDQMFVFASDDLDYILDTVITNIQLPLNEQQDICVPSNVIFLSARFAYYFSSNELLEQVLEGALDRISKAIKLNARNIHVLAFWITNLTKLLFYLKKDTGLVVATAEQQLRLSELISETYNMVIQDTEKRLLQVIGPAMLEHEEIPGMDQVEFTDDWHRFFRKSSSSRRSVNLAISTERTGTTAAQLQQQSAAITVSPQAITSLLSSTLFVLQSYDVHPIIIIQALAQFFHFLSCELFNRILTNKKLLSRSKAMQVRMNLSHVEDWVSLHKLPSSLLSYLNPSIQLLQLLQCLTQLKDLVDFINTSKKFDVLNASQIKKCVISYRYEVNEMRLPEEIEKYAMQCAEDTVRHRQQRRKQSTDNTGSIALSRTGSVALSRASSQKMSRRQSLTQYLGQFTAKSMPSTPICESLPPLCTMNNEIVVEEQHEATTAAVTNNNYHEEEEEEDVSNDNDIKETRDSKFMLPFTVPTTAQMVSLSHHHQYSTVVGHHEKGHSQQQQQRQIIPIIPDDWMDKLDKQ